MEYRFFLFNERTGRLEIDEPVKFDGFKPVFKRDAKAHGVTWEFAEQELDFYGRDGRIIKDEYDLYGVDGSIEFIVECNCGGAWQEFYKGTLDFARFSVKEGVTFAVSVGVAQLSTQMTLKSRMEMKVDVESLKTLDGLGMPAYGNLGKELMIPSKTVQVTNKTLTGDDISISYTQSTVYIFHKLPLGDVQNNEFDIVISESEFSRSSADPETYPNEYVIFENVTDNNIGTLFDVRISIMTTFDSPIFGGAIGGIAIVLVKRDGTRKTLIEGLEDLLSGLTPHQYNSNTEIGGKLEIKKGEKIIAYSWSITSGGFNPIVSITVHAGSYFEIIGASIFNPTPSKTFMLHETLSRIAEAITDGALTVKSDYYGRWDSNVNSAVADGVGSLRCLTNGLMLRQAKNAEEPKFTVSFKDIIDGLTAIDAIGYGIEGDKLVVEPWEYFYQNEVVLECDDIAEITRKVDTSTCFALVNIGYAKWEAEEWNGIDGFHGKRQYRTNIKNVDTKFEQYSKFIADCYAIEATRRRMLADASKDWRYDNDIFIFDLERVGNEPGIQAPVGTVRVIKGKGYEATLIDADNVFNVELSPLRNAARWYSWLIQGVKPENKTQLIYTSSEGYAGAQTQSLKKNAIISSEIREDKKEITSDIISLLEKKEPRFKSEIVEFKHPLSYKDFNKIKSNPYGLVKFNGELGWIKEVEADLIKGIGKFSLIVKK